MWNMLKNCLKCVIKTLITRCTRREQTSASAAYSYYIAAWYELYFRPARYAGARKVGRFDEKFPGSLQICQAVFTKYSHFFCEYVFMLNYRSILEKKNITRTIGVSIIIWLPSHLDHSSSRSLWVNTDLFGSLESNMVEKEDVILIFSCKRQQLLYESTWSNHQVKRGNRSPVYMVVV